MKYSTWIIVLAIMNSGMVFSGFPTSWKRFFIVISSLLLVGIALGVRAIEKRRKEIIHQQRVLETIISQELAVDPEPETSTAAADEELVDDGSRV